MTFFKSLVLLVAACLFADPAAARDTKLSLPLPPRIQGDYLPPPQNENDAAPSSLSETQKPGEMIPTAPPPPAASKLHPDAHDATTAKPRRHKKPAKPKPAAQ